MQNKLAPWSGKQKKQVWGDGRGDGRGDSDEEEGGGSKDCGGCSCILLFVLIDVFNDAFKDVFITLNL